MESMELVMVVRFVIVDDDENEIKHIKRLLEDIPGVIKDIKSFNQVNNELKEEIHNVDVRKIYILDIELGNNKISGINVAKLIRDVDFESEIVFITNHDKVCIVRYMKFLILLKNFIILTKDLKKILRKF